MKESVDLRKEMKLRFSNLANDRILLKACLPIFF